MSATNTSAERRARRVSAVVLVIAIGLVALSAAQALYQTTLPTEGWGYTEGETVDQFGRVIFTENLLGSPSPIQPGDQLLAVNGVPTIAPGSTLLGGVQRDSDAWRVGQTVQYRVVRAGRPLDLAVTLKSWTAPIVVGYLARNEPAQWLSGIFLFGLSTFVLLRRPDEPAARPLLLLAASTFATAIGRLVPDGPSTQLSAVSPLNGFFVYWIFAGVIGPSLLMLGLNFPQAKRVLQRFPWLNLLPYGAFWLLTLLLGLQQAIGWAVTLGCLLLALVSVAHAALTKRDRVSRAQLRWGFGGFLAAIMLFLPQYLVVFGALNGAPSALQALFSAVASVGNGLAFPVFACCIAVAILRYRLFDIDVIIRRTLVYSVLSLTLGATYLVGVVALQALFVRLTGQESALAVVASTLVIAALFGPVRRRVQAVIDRRFYRRKYDARLVLEQFALRAQQQADLDALAADIVGVVDETVQPEDVQLWLVR
ncbi:MAG: hypothetical protein H7Z42_03120 [Roseiflexaceae bacterium]|nr:hypothetical protein [Roseiflexaceae bacterium]